MKIARVETVPSITLAICTRDRPQVLAAVSSALSSAHERFEVLLVDQSERPVRISLPASTRGDPRFRYLHLRSRGVARARNSAIRAARGEVIAFIDDDCTVPAGWLRQVERAFQRNPGVGAVFTNVAPGPHDVRAGFIPTYERCGDALVTSMWGKRLARGIGAGMALRRQAVGEIGGFDESLGPGGDFPACEEGDVAVRLLLRGWFLLETGSAAVIHHGFRTWDEGRDLARRNGLGVGAAYAKVLKCGRLSIVPVLSYELYLTLRRAALCAWHWRKPQGLRDAIYLCEGIVRGLSTPVDRASLTFRRETKPKWASCSGQYSRQITAEDRALSPTRRSASS